MRPSIHETYLEMVRTLEKRTTCIRRGVGCVLADCDDQVLSTGYNGVAKNESHCNYVISYPGSEMDNYYPNACEGAKLSSGKGLGLCQAIHAEQNALLQCADVRKIYTAYISCTPCIHCVKLLMNTGCNLIVAHELYNEEAMRLWTKSGNRDFLIFNRELYV